MAGVLRKTICYCVSGTLVRHRKSLLLEVISAAKRKVVNTSADPSQMCEFAVCRFVTRIILLSRFNIGELSTGLLTMLRIIGVDARTITRQESIAIQQPEIEFRVRRDRIAWINSWWIWRRGIISSTGWQALCKSNMFNWNMVVNRSINGQR